MAISNLVLTQQSYSEETNGAHAHYHEPVPLNRSREVGNKTDSLVTCVAGVKAGWGVGDSGGGG